MLTELLCKVGRIVIGSYARLMLKMDVHWHGGPPQGPVLYAAPILGIYMRKMGQIEVIRGKGESNNVLQQAVRILASGRSVVIFPEGAISPVDGFAPVHSGVARLALQSGVPVIPMQRISWNIFESYLMKAGCG